MISHHINPCTTHFSLEIALLYVLVQFYFQKTTRKTCLQSPIEAQRVRKWIINLRLPYGILAALLAIKGKVWKERYGVLSPSWSSTFLRQGHIGITWDWQLWELFPIRKKKNMYFYHFCGNMKQWSYVKATDTEKDYVKICFLLWIYVKLGTNSVIT